MTVWAAIAAMIFFSQTMPVESVVATMNNRAITYSEILQEGELLNIENNIPPETPISPELQEEILELIFFRIITFEEAREQEVTINEKKVRQKMETYRKNVYMNAFLKKYEITELEFMTIIKMRLIADEMASRFIEQKFRGKNPSAEDKKRALDEWKKNLLKRKKIIYLMP